MIETGIPVVALLAFAPVSAHHPEFVALAVPRRTPALRAPAALRMHSNHLAIDFNCFYEILVVVVLVSPQEFFPVLVICCVFAVLTSAVWAAEATC